jgi:hypothetical protein
VLELEGCRHTHATRHTPHATRHTPHARHTRTPHPPMALHAAPARTHQWCPGLLLAGTRGVPTLMSTHGCCCRSCPTLPPWAPLMTLATRPPPTRPPPPRRRPTLSPTLATHREPPSRAPSSVRTRRDSAHHLVIISSSSRNHLAMLERERWVRRWAACDLRYWRACERRACVSGLHGRRHSRAHTRRARAATTGPRRGRPCGWRCCIIEAIGELGESWYRISAVRLPFSLSFPRHW